MAGNASVRKEVEIVKGHRLDYQLYKYFLQYFSENELEGIFESIRRPPSRYYIRVNTLRISPEELMRLLRERSVDVYPDEYLPEALWFPVKGLIRYRQHVSTYSPIRGLLRVFT